MGMRNIFKALLTLCASGLMSYGFPRLLIAAGVPLDAWIIRMGTWLGAPPDWANLNTATWLFTLVFGFVLFGAEVWRHPVQKFWQSTVGASKSTLQHSQDVMVDTPYVQWKDEIQYDLPTAAIIWSGSGEEENVTRRLCFKRLKFAIRAGELPAYKMNGSKPNKKTTVKTADLRGWFEYKNLMPKVKSGNAPKVPDPSHRVSEARQGESEAPERQKWIQTEAISDENPEGTWERIGARQDSTIETKRDVWLKDAIDFAITGDWSKEADLGGGVAEHLNALGAVLRNIRQEAFDGSLPIWGADGIDAVLMKPIPPEIWEHRGVDWFSVLRGDPEEICQEKDNRRMTDPVFRALQTSRGKFEKIHKEHPFTSGKS